MTSTTSSLPRRVPWASLLGMFAALVVAPATVSAQPPPPPVVEAIEYYGLDAIGSVRVVFDPAGTVLTRLDYAPFGRELTPAPGAPDRKFAQLFRDGEAGLDYAEARSYQGRTGRFNTPDPVYAGLFEPQRWNRYAYSLNAPTTFVDPNGLEALPCTRNGRQAICTDSAAGESHTVGLPDAAVVGEGDELGGEYDQGC